MVGYGCVVLDLELDNLTVLLYRSEGIGGEQSGKLKKKDYILHTTYIH